jgi:predicted unusual protein kinase regulating ubiquinone biosynthesis (AarF/ABC1/UbiB family)
MTVPDLPGRRPPPRTKSDAEPMPPSRPRFRLARAYWVTMRVMTGYAWLRLWRPVLGAGAYQARLAERHRANARLVERTIIQLDGLFIKVGQLISILTNFLPEDFRRGLEGLQDQLPPRPQVEIAARLRAEFGKGPSELFAFFDPNPVASASLAQVHVAQLHDGRRVAVKVQHADIDEIVPLDLRAIKRILGIVQLFTRVRGLESYHAEIRQMIMEELDFSKEAEHIETIASHFAANTEVLFPAVVRELSTRRVLTTEFVSGTKVTNVAELETLGIDRVALAQRILTAYCQMIFVDGVYHADPHPGNIIVQPDGSIVFVDFGAVGVLSPAMKEGIPAFLEGVLRRDPPRISAAMRRMGFIARTQEETDVAERVIEYFQRRFLDQVTIDSWNLSNVQVDIRTKLEAMADLRRLDVSFRQLTNTFQVPKDWVLLERTLLLLLGLCTYLAPSLNPMRTVQPYLEEFVLGRDRDWLALVRSSAKDMALAALTIPDGVRRLLARANRGELEIRVPEIRDAAELVYAAAHQFVYAVIGTGSGIVAYAAYARDEPTIAFWTTAIAVGSFLALIGSLITARRSRS